MFYHNPGLWRGKANRRRGRFCALCALSQSLPSLICEGVSDLSLCTEHRETNLVRHHLCYSNKVRAFLKARARWRTGDTLFHGSGNDCHVIRMVPVLNKLFLAREFARQPVLPSLFRCELPLNRARLNA